MKYHCCDERRLEAVRAHATLNGIEYLEVVDRDAPAGSPRQRTLLIHCLKPLPDLSATNVRLSGGERVREPGVLWAARADAVPAGLLNAAEQAMLAALPNPAAVLVVRTASSGDFSTYRLDLRRSPDDDRPPDKIDPLLAGIDFSFKVECPSDFDCGAGTPCPPPFRTNPDVDYLAKDYASFRRLLLDRLTHLIPDWRDRSPADLGVTCAEVLAYVGDHLSYQQDAIATEQYLYTARRRSSLRRHALLVDYRMHDGCNARAWVQVFLTDEVVPIQPGTLQFTTRVPDLPDRIVPGSTEWDEALTAGSEVFEVLREDPDQPVVLYKENEKLTFHTWGDRECCLPIGATSATLAGHRTKLHAGDVLIFEEVLGPLTGASADADPSHRHAVRLVTVNYKDADGVITDPLTGAPITHITWQLEDALPFSLCISSVTDEAHGASVVPDVSVAYGNILLADHGRTVTGTQDTNLGVVPPPALRLIEERVGCCDQPARPPVPVRFRPRLPRGPLTHRGMVRKEIAEGGRRTVIRVPVDETGSAKAAMRWSLTEVVPFVTLEGTKGTDTITWTARRDLLSSASDTPEFVVEIDDDGGAVIRFGDDRHGARPEPDTRFTAAYRIGNGPRGNVGAATIHHVVTLDARISKARNPLPATGGIEPESAEQVRRRAPQAFRTQERAVTPEDYASVTGRHAAVQRAAATLRWTGAWHTVFVTVDREGGGQLDAKLEGDLQRHVERYRMAGHDLEFDDPRFVSLELDMQVCVLPEYFRRDVQRALLTIFSRRRLPDGRRGVFHPDHFSFGQTIYLSPLYAAARGVPGVQSVRITRFQRQGIADTQYLDAGKLPLGRLEIARLDNDPSFPERGVLRLQVMGGR